MPKFINRYATKTLIKLITNYGFLKTFVFCLSKIKPNSFELVVKKLSVSTLIHSQYPEVYDLKLEIQERNEKIKKLRKITWFVPDWLNVWGGGHFTIFRFAHFFEQQGVKNEIFIYNNLRHQNGKALEKELRHALPGNKIKVIVDPNLLEETDIAIATTWQSAYPVKNFTKANFKFYFMQDYESLFYASGSQALQANFTYQFGFKGITGGLWLRSIYESYGGTAQHYMFATDPKVFYPDNEIRDEVKRIFFYGRPSTERRAFELGIAALAEIKKQFPSVEILIAGLDGLSPPPFKATLLGNLSPSETGKLYRSCDVGIALSATNLSYLPLELMASGCPVISNAGPYVEWFCKDGENCLIANPTPSHFAQRFRELYESKELRKKLRENGITATSGRTWESEMTKIFQYIENTVIEK